MSTTPRRQAATAAIPLTIGQPISDWPFDFGASVPDTDDDRLADDDRFGYGLNDGHGFDMGPEKAGSKDLLEHALRTQRAEAVGRMACALAHDVNNLLTIIFGHAEVLSTDCQDARQQGAEISKAAGRAAELTQKFLRFARCGMSPHPDLVNVHEVVRDLLPAFQQLAGKQVKITGQFRAEDPVVLIERSALEQVLINLVVNARDAMPGGGGITVATSSEVGAIVVEVSDTGCGIAPEVQARMFDLFFTTKTPDKGSGLGLSTVSDIVTRAGGTIRVHSATGKGASFRVRLPISSRIPLASKAQEKR